jgi:hypothetical protein
MKRSPIVTAAVLSAGLGALATLALFGGAGASIVNKSPGPVLVYVAFGADSGITSWDFCHVSGRLQCKFPLAPGEQQVLPTSGKYLNATISFGGPVTCGKTKVELNLNNPKWFDIIDISLVDGFDRKVSITAKDSSGTHELAVKGPAGNEKAFGVYPLGCDICTARQNPPCGMSPGSDGCKLGTQYKPDVPCQYQGSKMGGGTTATITLF